MKIVFLFLSITRLIRAIFSINRELVLIDSVFCLIYLLISIILFKIEKNERKNL